MDPIWDFVSVPSPNGIYTLLHHEKHFSEKTKTPMPNMFLLFKDDALFKLKRCWRYSGETSSMNGKWGIVFPVPKATQW